MTESAVVESKTLKSNISKEYQKLIFEFPHDNKDNASELKGSFPSEPIKENETAWAKSFLKLGENKDILSCFSQVLGDVSARGLQLLREEVKNEGKNNLESLSQNLDISNLTNFLRSDFQTWALYYEEGVRSARDIDNNFWFGEGNQFEVAKSWLRLSRDAAREVDEFKNGKTGSLSLTKKWINANYDTRKNSADHNFNYLMENDPNSSVLRQSIRDDDKELVFWSSLKAFCDNLELSVLLDTNK